MTSRRAFIGTLAGGLLTAPLAVEAQRTGKVPHVGVLHPSAPPEPLVEAFREGLRALGYVEGQNIRLEFRWAEGRLVRLPELAAELVGLRVDVISTFGAPAALAARQATTTIPIVFIGGADLVGTGLVSSLAHPGGNVTGISVMATELSGKRLEILREMVPRVARVAMLWNDTNPGMVLRAREAEGAAVKLGVTIQSVGVHDLIGFDQALTTIVNGRAGALLTLIDPFTRQHRHRIVDFAAQRRLPALYESREFVEAGGLMSYGPNLPDNFRRGAVFVDKILKGAKPADLPVEQPTKFELVINLKTAKALGLTIPPSVLGRADQVIE